jgi:glycine/D-amino acid oxidase-like deaminating enzyme
LERTEVLIVGAGLAGASLAWHAAGRFGLTVLEQGDAPLGEASAQNAGMVRRFVAHADERALACRSYDGLIALGDHPDWSGAPPFRRTGAVIAFAEAPPTWAEEAYDDLSRRGVHVEEVDSDRLADVAPALGGARLERAYWLPDEGVCDAWTLGQGLLRGASARGAELRCGVRVTALRTDEGRVTGVETDRGPIAADAVVLAAGAWGQALGRTAGSSVILTPRARHLLQSRPHELSNRDHPWCWVDDAGLYVRPEAGGFLCSPCDEVERDPGPGPGSSGPVETLGRALAQDKLGAITPRLADLGFQGGWNGLRTFAPDRQPRIGGDPDVQGLFWVGGLGGSGLTCALAVGEVAASILSSRVAPVRGSDQVSLQPPS